MQKNVSGPSEPRIGASGPVAESFGEQDTARTRLAALTDSVAAPSGSLFPNVGPKAHGATAAPAPPTLGRRIALVIGNGAYVHAPQLLNPTNDARVIAGYLRDMGFDVSDGIDLDRAAMMSLIADFLRAAATANIAVLFYAGHGVQIDGENFLLPIDVKFNGVRDLMSEMTNVRTILAGLDDSIRTNIVFLDAAATIRVPRRSCSRQTQAAPSEYPPALPRHHVCARGNHGGRHPAGLLHGSRPDRS
jgi:Caspase domain